MNKIPSFLTKDYAPMIIERERKRLFWQGVWFEVAVGICVAVSVACFLIAEWM